MKLAKPPLKGANLGVSRIKPEDPSQKIQELLSKLKAVTESHTALLKGFKALSEGVQEAAVAEETVSLFVLHHTSDTTASVLNNYTLVTLVDPNTQ